MESDTRPQRSHRTEGNSLRRTSERIGITEKIIEFRDARDWKQFHNPKDLSISLALEAAEVMEHFQWKNTLEIKQQLQKNKTKLGEELADVLIYLIYKLISSTLTLPKLLTVNLNSPPANTPPINLKATTQINIVKPSLRQRPQGV